MADNKKPCFSVGIYDRDGDIYKAGIYLHYGDTMVKIAEDEEGFEQYIEHLTKMLHEIKENY